MTKQTPSAGISKLSMTLVIVGSLLSIATSAPMYPELPAEMGLICGRCSSAGWDVQSGSFEAVPTWHEQHLGTALVGDPFLANATTFSQSASQELDDDNGCVTIQYLAMLEPNVSVILRVDLDNDGVMDASKALLPASWASQSMDWVEPGILTATKFQLEKTGSGEAVFEHLFLGLCYN